MERAHVVHVNARGTCQRRVDNFRRRHPGRHVELLPRYDFPGRIAAVINVQICPA